MYLRIHIRKNQARHDVWPCVFIFAHRLIAVTPPFSILLSPSLPDRSEQTCTTRHHVRSCVSILLTVPLSHTNTLSPSPLSIVLCPPLPRSVTFLSPQALGQRMCGQAPSYPRRAKSESKKVPPYCQVRDLMSKYHVTGKRPLAARAVPLSSGIKLKRM